MSGTTRRVFHREASEPLRHNRRGNNYLFAIAIDEYAHCPNLHNAVRDVRDFQDLLESDYDFRRENMITLFNQDASEDNILYQFRQLARLITPSDNLLMYFSGHGRYDETFQMGYWIPWDAHPDRASQQISNQTILWGLKQIHSHHTFLIVDSCFAGGMFTQFRNTGTERLETTASRWGLTAGRNEVVADGTTGANSPFASSLLYHLRQNRDRISVGQLCQLVVEDVSSNNLQMPRGEPLGNAGHRGGQFFFHRRGAPATAPSDRPAATAAETAPPVPTAATAAPAPRPARDRGQLMHSIPHEMEIGRDVRCEIRIAFDRETLLEDFPDPPAHVQIRAVTLSERMRVELVDPAFSEPNFRVRPINATEQFVDSDQYTQWIVMVCPLRPGKHELMVKVSTQEQRNGQWVPREIVLTETVEVVAEPVQTVEQDAYRVSPFRIEVATVPSAVVSPSGPARARPSAVPRLGPPPAKTRIPWAKLSGAAMILLVGMVGTYTLLSDSDAPSELPDTNFVVDNQEVDATNTENPEPLPTTPGRESSLDIDYLVQQGTAALERSRSREAAGDLEGALRINQNFLNEWKALDGLPNADHVRLVRIRGLLQTNRDRLRDKLATPNPPGVDEAGAAPGTLVRPEELFRDRDPIELRPDTVRSVRVPTTLRPELVPPTELITPPDGSVTDARSHRSYPYTTANGLRWITQNLDYEVEGSQRQYFFRIDGAGRLYTADQAAAACPAGWRLPTTAEFRKLVRTHTYAELTAPPFNFSLFGFMKDGDHRDHGKIGSYWTGSFTAGRRKLFVFQKLGQRVSPSSAFGQEYHSCRCVQQ